MQSKSTVVDHRTEIHDATKQLLDLLPLSSTKSQVRESTVFLVLAIASHKTHRHLWSDHARTRFLFLMTRRRLDTQSEVALVVSSEVWMAEQ